MNINFLTFNVLSSYYTYFNLQRCPPNFNHETEIESNDVREYRHMQILYYILSVNPDIGCLQEVEGILYEKLSKVFSNGNEEAMKMGIYINEYEENRIWDFTYTYKKNIKNTNTGLLIFYRKNKFNVNKEWLQIIENNIENTTILEENNTKNENISFGIDYGIQKYHKNPPDFVEIQTKIFSNPNKWSQIICLKGKTNSHKNIIVTNVHLEGDPNKSVVRNNQFQNIINYYEYLDKNLKGNNYSIIAGDWNDEDPIYPYSVLNHYARKANIKNKMAFLPYFRQFIDVSQFPKIYRNIATSYQINNFDFEEAKKENKKNTKLDYKQFYSYNNDPWKIIDHIVISDNIYCNMINLYPNNPQGVIGLHVPYSDTENMILSNWPSDHAALTMNIELLD
jgi:endonuclease/exonuclease/phosphatase family metal-dependent hydrolase